MSTSRQSKQRKGMPEGPRRAAWNTGSRASPTFSLAMNSGRLPNGPPPSQRQPKDTGPFPPLNQRKDVGPFPPSNQRKDTGSFPPLNQRQDIGPFPPSNQRKDTGPFPLLNQQNGARPQESDRILQSLAGLIGTTVTISTKTSQKYEGVVGSISCERDTTGVTLKDVKDISLSGAPLKDSMFIPSTSIDAWVSGPADDKAVNGDSFKPGKAGSRRERDLIAWVSDSPNPNPIPTVAFGAHGDDVTFGPGASSGRWDQFVANEKLFGVKVSFDEEVYTTKLDRSGPDFKERQRRAQQIANEIMDVIKWPLIEKTEIGEEPSVCPLPHPSGRSLVAVQNLLPIIDSDQSVPLPNPSDSLPAIDNPNLPPNQILLHRPTQGKQEAASPSPPADFNTPAWKCLITRSLPPSEIISLIGTIFVSKDEVKTVCTLRGNDAQAFVDAIHDARNLPDLPPRHLEKCVGALYRICGRCAILPRSLQIPTCYDRSSCPMYRGGFADVWKGEHLGRQVAVKVLRTYSSSETTKVAGRFCKEVVAWNALCHPNVLPFLGVTADKNQFAIISEWMENGNIHEFLKANWEANPFELFQQVTDGLMYIHDQGMIHGDLKGLNILIDQGKRARLADFGLLTIVSDHTNFPTPSYAPTGGTTRWMSPELLHPELFDPSDGRPTKASDCYALGMVILEVLTGQPPFALLQDHIVSRKVTDGGRPERPEGVKGTWFTDELWKMLHLCWGADSRSRPTIGAVRECLKHVSNIWKPLPPQLNVAVGEDENDWDLSALSDLVL